MRSERFETRAHFWEKEAWALAAAQEGIVKPDGTPDVSTWARTVLNAVAENALSTTDLRLYVLESRGAQAEPPAFRPGG